MPDAGHPPVDWLVRPPAGYGSFRRATPVTGATLALLGWSPYATLPGHPEHGVERFTFERAEGGLLFVVEAVSRPSSAIARVVPWIADQAQAQITERYLRAARRLGQA